ncbi:MAG: DUF4376 domain-containing protein [Smithellaceae bacterium]|nr:DUF4376 domain-containing protein [Smithellaceae bacterium]
MAKLYSAVEKGFYDTEIHANIPEDAVPISDKEYFALMQAQSAGKIISPDNNGKPIAADRVFTIAEKKALKKAGIEALRDAKIAAGVPYTFPGGVSGTIQTRDQRDFRNITGISVAGLIQFGQDITLKFRDQDDVDHDITPSQAVDLGAFVMQRVSDIYNASWRKKDAVEALSSPDAIDSYDIASDWPV